MTPETTTIETLKNASDILANVATAAAIVVGAAWAYWRFLRERTRWPRAALSLEFTERPLDGSTVLLSVKLHVTNEGRGLMRLTELRFDLYRVRPLDPKMRSRISAECARAPASIEADWPNIDHLVRTWPEQQRPELEPEESDEYACDFFLAPSERTVFLYAYLENERKKRGNRKLGWTATAFHDLAQQSIRGRLASLLPGGNS